MNRKRLLIAILVFLAVTAATIGIYVLTPVSLPSGVQDKITKYTRNKPRAELTVVTLTPDSTEVTAYGHDGERIPVTDRTYEIGGITRAFTGAIAAKAIAEGRLSPNESCAELLPLARPAYEPTIFELLTDSAAYSAYAPGIRGSGYTGRNPYSGIDGNELIAQMNTFKLSYKPPYLYSCSLFGAAVAGAAVSQAYDVDFYSILTIFAQEELGLKHTCVSLDGGPDHAWQWRTNDAYIAALGLTSTAGDMTALARLYLSGEYSPLNDAVKRLLEINADADAGYLTTVRSDGVIWLTGETGHYAACMMVDRENKQAVIVLSNYPNDRYGNVNDIAEAVFAKTLAAVKAQP